MLDEFTVGDVTQPAFETIVTLIELPVGNVFDEKVAFVAFAISLVPFFHWYDGEVPPLIGLAVNVIVCPSYVLLVGETPILTDAVNEELNVIVTAADVALSVVLQVAVEFIITLNWSLFEIDEVVYVAFVAPEIFVEFFLH